MLKLQTLLTEKPSTSYSTNPKPRPYTVNQETHTLTPANQATPCQVLRTPETPKVCNQGSVTLSNTLLFGNLNLPKPTFL